MPELRLGRDPVRRGLRDLCRGLVAARQRLARRQEALPSIELPRWVSGISGADAALGVLLFVCAFAYPVVGGPIAGLFAYFAHHRGDLTQRNLALAAVAVAVFVILLVSLAPERAGWVWPWVDLSGPFPSN